MAQHSPNFSLTNCHSCNCKTSLQPLYSVWRIILLCKKCHKSITSGQTCPYCLKPIRGDFVKCSVCHNKIHFSCVKDFMTCTPWCYAGIEFGEFFTCADCWVPDFRKISVKLCGENELLDKELAVRFRRIFSRFPKIPNSEFFIDPFDLRVWKILSWDGISYKRIGSRRSDCDGDRDSVGLLTYKRDKNRKVVKIDEELELGLDDEVNTVSVEELELGLDDDGGVSCSSGVLEALLCFEAAESGGDVEFSADQISQISSWINVERFGENFATYKRRRIASTNVNLFWRRSEKHVRIPISSTDSVLEAHCCPLNQSPWDVVTDFSPPPAPPLFPQYQVGLKRFGENFATYKRRRIASTNVNLFWRRSEKHARIPISSTNRVLEAHCCPMNQSPWDVVTDFSPPSSPPLFPQYQVH